MTLANPAIGHLFFASCPPAITRLVIPVVVRISVKAGSVRTWPHIGKEFQEVAAPFVAHRNTAPAIIGIADVLRLKASVLSASPRSVFLCMFQSMLEKPFARYFRTMASASLRGALHKMRSLHGRIVATVAQAVPSSLTILGAFWMERENQKFSKSTTDKIYEAVRQITSAASSRTENQLRANNDGRLPAHAGALPLSVLGFVNTGIFDNGQASKRSARNVFEIGAVLSSFLFSHDASRGVVVRAALGASHTVAARLVYHFWEGELKVQVIG